MIKNLFLSIGAMKAGTTWLYGQLKNHPGIYFTPEKEIHYFANVNGIGNQLKQENRITKFNQVLSSYKNDGLNKKNLERVFWYAKFAQVERINDVWFESLFAENPGKKYCADFSNLTALLDDRGWMRVRDNCRNLRVIYILRDPLMRMWSHYKFNMKWVGREDEVISAGKEHFMQMVQHPSLWEPAEYHKTLGVLERCLRKEECRVYFSEDLYSEPEKYLFDIEEFLDIRHIAYDKGQVSKPVNQTKDFDLPEEWAEFLLEKLKPIYADLQSRGFMHKDWGGAKLF